MIESTTLDGKSLMKEIVSNEQRRSERELGEYLQTLEEKYESLVWFARSNPKDSVFWDKVPAEIRTGALNSQARVEEQYPDEIDELRSDHGSWTHGFNSGMLACLRLIQTASNPQLITDPDCSDDGQPFWVGGLEEAKEEFPCLDT